MHLEWQLLVSHTIGFLITLWLLKKFAWGPILAMLDERREKIVGEFDEIDRQKQETAKLASEYEGKLKDIDIERRAKLVEGVNEGKKIAEELKSAAQGEVVQMRIKAKDDLAREVDKAKATLRDDMIAITMSAAGKLINERLDDAKHRELVGGFIRNVEKA